MDSTLKTSVLRRESTSRRTLDITSTRFLSNLLYIWVFRLISLCRTVSDVRFAKFRLPSDLFASRNGKLLEDAWSKVKTNKSPRILDALTIAYQKKFLFVGVWKILWAIFTWTSSSLVLFQFLDLLASSSAQKYSIHLWAFGFLLTSLLASISIHQLYGKTSIQGFQIKAALTVLVYKKALALARVKGGAGEVINIVSCDVSRVQDAVLYFHFFWTSIIETAVILLISIILLGVPALSALAIMLLLVPIQVYLGLKTCRIQSETTKITTERVHIMSELLTAIKLIKFYAWEAPFAKRISDIRAKEVNLLLKSLRIKAINYTLVFATPIIVAIVSLVIYQQLNNSLDAKLSFTALAVFNTLRYPLLMLPQSVKSITGAKVSLERLSAFLLQPEVEPVKILTAPLDCQLAFKLRNSTFTWEGEEFPTLHGLTLEIKKGEILAVIGDVGAGKSSFIAALLGQIRQTSGYPVEIYGTMSYVPQEAWMLNFSLRENILFGAEYDKDHYNQVIRVCALERDLQLLAFGDATEIAERGANLSGGQRQRASLARAVYNDADIVLLDDPLSAVDQAVGRHIFNELIKTHLKGKTVVIVTHQLQYLEEVDKILQLKEGRISKFGSFSDLMANDKEFAEFINCHVSTTDETDDAEALNLIPTIDNHVPVSLDDPQIQCPVELNQLTVKSLKNFHANQQTITKMLERGNLEFIQNAGKSHDFASIIRRNELTVLSLNEMPTYSHLPRKASLCGLDEILANEISDCFNTSKLRRRVQSSIDPLMYSLDPKVPAVPADDPMPTKNFGLYFNLSKGYVFFVFLCFFFCFVHVIRVVSDVWLKFWISPKNWGLGNSDYILIYGALVFLFTVGVFVRGWVFASESASKARIMHDMMFQRVLRAPMAFFDTTPLGRILSAFSKHQLNLDETMPDAVLQVLQYVPLSLGALLVVWVLSPWSVLFSIVLFGFAFALVVWASRAESLLKSAEAATKPPIFSHLATSLDGLFSIRAYNAQERFCLLNSEKLDSNHQLGLSLAQLKSWTALYLDLITCFVIYLTAILCIFTKSSNLQDHSSNAGLSISNVLQLLVFLQWSVRMLGDIQEQVASVGIMTYYSNIKQEAPDEIPDSKPPLSWPSNGIIKFNDVVLKYQEFGVAVLKKVSFTINSKEKIGIVGRTGSGKSTLLVSLLRIVELTEGQIIIDGIDISSIGLRDLRKKIAIIPQEPVLFVGSIRSNLDPFNRSSDEEIWKALKSVHLDVAINAMPLKLDSPVIENGKNFSLGQRQLFCIARAILSKTKILVLDEATAAIDMQTDALIQTAIKENFADLTVLTIAHRLNTIIECDKILVMEAGQVVEFDSPHVLLCNQNGHFAGLVANTGETSARKLAEIAKDCHERRLNETMERV